MNKYPTKQTTIGIGNSQIKLTIVEDPDRFLDKLSREDCDGRLYLPYWTYLWESAIGLARHVSELGSSFAGQQILEIGCGFGLAGIVAGKEGAAVIFSDFEYDALLFAKHNAQQNRIYSADFVQMDWNIPCFQCQFDVILASDVIYEEQNWQPIIDLLKKYLKPDGTVIFSEPNRRNAGGFFKDIRKNGFTFEKSTCFVTVDNIERQINLYAIRWDRNKLN